MSSMLYIFSEGCLFWVHFAQYFNIAMDCISPRHVYCVLYSSIEIQCRFVSFLAHSDCIYKLALVSNITSPFLSELGTRYFFPGSLIANSLFLDHGWLSLNR